MVFGLIVAHELGDRDISAVVDRFEVGVTSVVEEARAVDEPLFVVTILVVALRLDDNDITVADCFEDGLFRADEEVTTVEEALAVEEENADVVLI